MKKRILAFLISIVAGAIAGALAVILLFSPPMMLENESRYDFETTLTTVQQSAEAAGWSIPIVHDLQQSMAKAGKEVNQVKVFELCKPDYAVKVLGGDEERIYSSMIPCRVSVYTKTNGKTYVSRLNIPKMYKNMSPNVKSAMKSAYRDMEKILSGIIVKRSRGNK
jgi:uncharacterized protein (DUF302 family)